MNYASMGTVIGHEINHGMSGTGLEYDENGLKRFWASDQALAKFNETSRCLHSQYVQEHNHEAMASRTNNEDQADATGVIAGYFAYQNWIQSHSDEGRLPSLEKYTPNQLFWISYGRYWCAVESEQYLNTFLFTNIHSRNMYRVRVPLMNSEEFSKDFKCPSGSKMNPVKKCKIWN
ncbi:hypothetical protein RI129_002780 [Pyrocoelia pectoralis]|uniref:Peptidase M13 C-terminal domain-containing protein n=1 Tax=Pyrocoelia pectoralis TaxID=417401 RepID=A0AAN7ZU43_9COLE